MYRILIVTLLIMGISSCSQIDDNTNQEVAEEDERKLNDSIPEHENYDTLRLIQSVLNETKPISLPISIRLHSFLPDFKTMTEYAYKSKESGLLVRHQQNFVFGYLPDTSHYFGIVSFIPADFFVPVLILYSKKGKRIGEATLVANGCTPDCGVEKCTVDFMIDKKLNVVLTDTNHFYLCTQNGDEVPETREFFALEKRFSISSEGKITSKKETRSDIK